MALHTSSLNRWCAGLQRVGAVGMRALAASTAPSHAHARPVARSLAAPRCVPLMPTLQVPSGTCSAALRCLSTAAAPPPDVPAAAAAPSTRIKHKDTFKRASEIMSVVRARTASARMATLAAWRPPMPDFAVGDAVEIIVRPTRARAALPTLVHVRLCRVQYASENADTSPVPVRGTVMAKRNAGIDSSFTIINAWGDEWYTATYPVASPLLRRVRVLMRKRFSDGTARPRRAKLTYLMERDPKTYFVDQNTKEAAEKAAERAERMALQRAGKVYRKRAAGPGGKGVGPGGAAAKAGQPADAKKAATPAAAKGKDKK